MNYWHMLPPEEEINLDRGSLISAEEGLGVKGWQTESFISTLIWQVYN